MSPLWILLVMFLNVVAGMLFMHAENNGYPPEFPIMFWLLESLIVVLWGIKILFIGVMNYGT